MNTLIGIIATITPVSGITSAFYWYKSSKVMIMPTENRNGSLDPIPIQENPDKWIKSVYLSIEKTGALNKKASIYTAIAVSFGAVASFISIFS